MTSMTEERVRGLRREAYEAGDYMMGATCDLALLGEEEFDTDDYSVLEPSEARRLRSMSQDEALGLVEAALAEGAAS